jgi:hypothetical protein
MNISLTLRVFTAFFLVLSAADLKAESLQQNELKTASNLIDAFYSFDKQKLDTALTTAESSKPLIIFYQGWAKGGNYEIAKRMPCIQSNAANKDDSINISCSITVKDDLMKALDIPFDVTDTFHLTFHKQVLSNVTTSSNDLQVFRDAEKWVWSQRTGSVQDVCKGYFKGGPSPGECVKAMVNGYAEFANSEDFPKEVIFEQN